MASRAVVGVEVCTLMLGVPWSAASTDASSCPLHGRRWGGVHPRVGRAGWGRAANLAKAMRVPEQVLTPGRKVTSVLEPCR